MTALPVRISPPAPASAARDVPIPQYTRRAVLAVWAAAALPMAALAWVVAPRLATSMTGPVALLRALSVCLLAGLVWQFVLVVALVGVEQRSLRWAVLREALWLRAPRSPRTGRSGGRLWLLVLPLAAALYAASRLPRPPMPAARDLESLLGSDAAQQFLLGNWPWFAVLTAMLVFNTVLGEELLFRGFLLPRMNRAFGNRDWLVNGVLFAVYHLHEPWQIPAALLDALILAYPSKRYRSAWIGIVVHSAQTVFFTVVLLVLVIGR